MTAISYDLKRCFLNWICEKDEKRWLELRFKGRGRGIRKEKEISICLIFVSPQPPSFSLKSYSKT